MTLHATYPLHLTTVRTYTVKLPYGIIQSDFSIQSLGNQTRVNNYHYKSVQDFVLIELQYVVKECEREKIRLRASFDTFLDQNSYLNSYLFELSGSQSLD